jgi:hypothetical protein
MNLHLIRLYKTINLVCPIEGVSGQQGDIRIDFKVEATAQERTAAQNVIDNFDWSEATHAQWELDQDPDRKNLLALANTFIQQTIDYQAIVSPTNAQAIAFTKQAARGLELITKYLKKTASRGS